MHPKPIKKIAQKENSPIRQGFGDFWLNLSNCWKYSIFVISVLAALTIASCGKPTRLYSVGFVLFVPKKIIVGVSSISYSLRGDSKLSIFTAPDFSCWFSCLETFLKTGVRDLQFLKEFEMTFISRNFFYFFKIKYLRAITFFVKLNHPHIHFILQNQLIKWSFIQLHNDFVILIKITFHNVNTK